MTTYNGGCFCADCATLPPADTTPHEPRFETDPN